MSDYTQQILKVTVAQLCQTIGWNSIQSTPLELMSDILNKYIKEIATQTHRYSELCKIYRRYLGGKVFEIKTIFRWTN